jgi:hypothetical protein
MQNSQLADAENSALIWILNKAQEWEIQFELNQQLVEHFNIHLYSCHLRKFGHLAIGFGADHNRRRAQLKAAMESLERRLVIDNSWKHSSGTSLHIDPHIAREKAINEALERDAFFCHFYTQTSFGLLDDCKLSDEWSDLLKKRNLIGELRRLHSHGDINVVVAALRDEERKIGICIGLGANQSAKKAAIHAQNECLSFYSYLVSSKSPVSFNINQFRSKEDWSVFDHGHLGKDIEYGEWFWDTYLASPSSYRTTLNGLPTAQEYQITGVIQDAPFSLWRADQTGLQEPFWGRYDELNQKRLEEFCGKKWEQIIRPSYPHCFT